MGFALRPGTATNLLQMYKHPFAHSPARYAVRCISFHADFQEHARTIRVDAADPAPINTPRFVGSLRSGLFARICSPARTSPARRGTFRVGQGGGEVVGGNSTIDGRGLTALRGTCAGTRAESLGEQS
jgi:hypothetical protein